MFVSNRFGIDTSSTYTGPDGNTVAGGSLTCQGNGNDAGAGQPAVQGVIDMVIRYGVGSGGNELQSPTQFLDATHVNGLKPDGDGRQPWERVTAVSVCIVVRSLENARMEDKAGTVRTYRNCRGDNKTLPAGNRYIYASYMRVFAVRNNLNSVAAL